ncbi:MAG: hypothetical protein HQL80_05480 [Magnetococcales bacterium]|nr:hypothetical protein [Magnetococcales bacterium]
MKNRQGVLRGDSFLERCDPRAKLVALFLFMPILLAQPLISWGWGMAVVLLAWGFCAGLTVLWSPLLRQVWRLRWFFATLLLLHGLLTPGQPLWPGWELVSREGVLEGMQQSVRLIMLVALSWMLVRTTTPLQWVVGLYRLFGGLGRLGLPVKQWFSIMAFALGSIPYLLQESHRVGQDLLLRLTPGASARWHTRLQRTAQGGEALLFRLLTVARAQEESLAARGMGEGLPFVVLQQTVLGWRDLLLLTLPAAILLGVTLL